MTQPLPPDNDFVPEELPLRHRGLRVREAENIRQEFIRSRQGSAKPQGDTSANPPASDEQ
jgi:hypothetical protein